MLRYWRKAHQMPPWLMPGAITAMIAGLLILFAGALLDSALFFRAWLYGWTVCFAVAAGALLILMLQYLVTGVWGWLMRRPLESAALTLPFLALLLLPLLFGLGHVYPWADPARVANDPLLQHKQLYLNGPAFIVRALIYFTIWSLLAWRLRRLSLHADAGTLPRNGAALFATGAGGLVAVFITLTFAAVDWWMSLEPRWYSTIYAVQVMIGFCLMALATATLVLLRQLRSSRTVRILTPARINDLGNLLLAFTLLWTYMAFMQFLIIWNGNLPEDVTWYVHRTQHGWRLVTIALVLFHFVLPFAILLSRPAKRKTRVVAAVALLILVMHLVNLYWLIAPAFESAGFPLLVMSLAALGAVGGSWLVVWSHFFAAAPALPVHGPFVSSGRTEEAEESETVQ